MNRINRAINDRKSHTKRDFKIIIMDFFSAHKSQIEKYLTQSQILTLQLLIWLLQVHKEVKIERLASCLLMPILYESRRKKIQRFLVLSSLSLPLFWFPIIKSIVEKEFKLGERLILVLDRTQWQDNNVFMRARDLEKKRTARVTRS